MDIEVRVEQGKALDVILQVAEETQAELVVAGVARDETLGRLLLGTTVEKLVRHIPVPVLVVKERPRHPYRNVLVATDFSEGSRHAVDAVVNLLPGTPFKLYHALNCPLRPACCTPRRSSTVSARLPNRPARNSGRHRRPAGRPASGNPD